MDKPNFYHVSAEQTTDTFSSTNLDVFRAEPSTRICNACPTIIDILHEKYPSTTFDLAPGMPFLSPDSLNLTDSQKLLSETVTAIDLSKYDDVTGSSTLRNRWANYLFNTSLRADSTQVPIQSLLPEHEMMITAGANQAFVNVMLTICNPNDEILLVLPYYFSHLNAIILTGANPVYVKVDPCTLLPSLSDLDSVRSERTRALVVTNPGNPSGVIVPSFLLNEISRWCRKHNLFLILDEAYREYNFVQECVGNPVYSPPFQDHIIKLYTMSKAFGLAGWRIGAVVYPRSLSTYMRKAQDTIPTHAVRFSQLVAIEALRYKPPHIDLAARVRNIFLKNLRPVYLTSSLKKWYREPKGAFYLFLPYRNPSEAKPTDDEQAVNFLALKFQVLSVPGNIFGMSGYIRVCYGAVGEQKAVTASETLAHGLRELLNRHHSSAANDS